MKRAAWVILALALAATRPAAAQEYVREELRIPMAAHHAPLDVQELMYQKISQVVQFYHRPTVK